MKPYQSWKLTFTDGSTIVAYCKKSEILDNITARQFIKLLSIEVINRPSDTTKHRPINKEDLLNS